MKKVLITAKMFLIEGGCNACGFVNCCTYTAHFTDSHSQTLDDLNPESLVMAVALKNGWRQSVEPIGIGEEAFFLKKQGEAIQIIDDSFKTVFKKGMKTITAVKKDCELPTIYETTNQVLTEMLEIPAVEFELETI